MSTALLEPPSPPSGTPSRPTPRRSAPARRMALKVRMDDHEVVTVRVEGNLDIYTITRLRTRLAHFDLSGGRVILDLSQITLIDSAGLGTLLSLANRARRDGGRLPVMCTSELAGVLQIARLADAFDLTVVDSTTATVG